MSLRLHHPLLDEILSCWSPSLGPHFPAYRNHAYRVFNAARALLATDHHDDTLAVAAAMHDLGIWSDATFDYLPPSIARARDFLAARALDIDPDLVARVIDQHHRVRAYLEGPDAPIIDAFRRADWADLTRGWLRGGLSRAAYAELVEAFPFAGFHGVIVRTALAWTMRHPLRPAPMLRW
jgi:hypothetical protein